jgi:hypothetical protein
MSVDEITPEMIRAGVRAYYHFTLDELAENAENVVTAVLRAAILSEMPE